MNYRTTLSQCLLAISTLLATLPRLGVAAIGAVYASMWRTHALLRFACLAPHMLAHKVAIVVCALFLNLLGTGYASAAITATPLITDASSGTDAATYTTVSFAPPTANNLILAWVTNTRASSPAIPTLSGNGLTWVQVATVTWGTVASPTARTTLFRAMGASPSGGAVTIDFAGSTQTGVGTSIIQFGDVDTSGTNGSGAVVQSVTGSTDNASAAAGLSINLAALGNAANATAGGFANFVNSATSISAGAGYTASAGTTFTLPSTSIRSEWDTSGSTTVNVTQSTTSHIGGIAVEIKAAITTLGNGTAPGNTTLAPGGAATNAGAFSFQTSSGTDIITAATVTLAAGTSGGLGLVEITNVAGTIVYGSVTNPASDTPAITLSTNTLTTTTTLTEYRIRVTPKSHATMPAPAGSSYAVTARISAWSSSYIQVGSDSAGTTVTIDNLSPGNATASTATAGNAQVALSWTNPADADLASIVVLRRPTSAVADTPAEGATYVAGNIIGTSTVACVVASPGTSCTDTGLTNGTAYNYKVFARDSNGNYSAAGVVPTGSPATPTPTLCPGNVVTTTADTGVGSLRECINTANLNPGTTISFNIPGPGNQSSGADSWWRITPLTWLPGLIASNTIIDGTTQTANRGNTNSLGPEIEINGATVGGVGLDGFGVSSSATNVTIRGFIINNWSGAGISLWTGTGTVTGNYIGTNYAGTTALPNTSYGIYVNTDGNIIGGTTAAARNIISGNSGPGIRIVGNSNTVQGNYIGVNVTAGGALTNASDGIQITATATGNTIGGTAAGAGNVISGNTSDGIDHSASGTNNIYGNYIGTNASSASLPNGGVGLSTSAGTINLGNASETQSNIIGPISGVGINLAGGAINLAGTITVNDDVTLSSGTLSMGSATLNVAGNWIRTSATITPGTSTVVLNGASNQTITTGGASFNNLTLNNTGAAGSDRAVISGALTTSGALTVTDGTLDIGTNNPAVNTAGNVTISTAGSINVTGRTGTAWIFNGTSTFTDSSSTGPQQLGSITVGGSSSTLNLASSMKVWSMTINAGNTANLGSGGYTLEITIGGTPLWNAGTFTAGISTVRYTGYLAGVTVAPNATFNSLELAPGGAATYSLGNATTVTGNLTIGANTSFTTTTNNYALNVAGNWSNSGTFVANGGTVTLNGTNQTITGNTTFNNFTKSVSSAATLTFAAGSTTTINGLATVNGASGQLLSLRSSVNGTRWNIRFAGTKSISFVDVRDSDASGSATAQKPIGPTNSTDSGNNVDWFTIPTVVKSMTIISDPLNNTTNPKAIPGAVIEYTITIANGAGASTATNIVLTDSLNANITAGRLAFNPNTYAAGQGVQVTAPNINGGAAQNLTNAADADAGDFNVTGTNTVTVSGITLTAGQSATVKFRVTVQ